jgi:hypothetical protein
MSGFREVSEYIQSGIGVVSERCQSSVKWRPGRRTQYYPCGAVSAYSVDPECHCQTAQAQSQTKKKFVIKDFSKSFRPFESLVTQQCSALHM